MVVGSFTVGTKIVKHLSVFVFMFLIEMGSFSTLVECKVSSICRPKYNKQLLPGRRLWVVVLVVLLPSVIHP